MLTEKRYQKLLLLLHGMMDVQRIGLTRIFIYLIGWITSTTSAGVQETVICQGQSRELGCTPGNVIYIHHGFYGRTNAKTCGQGESQNRICQEGSHAVIWSLCEGMPKCNLTSTDVDMKAAKCLENNQYSFQKYISIKYQCNVPGKTTIGTCGPESSWGGWLSTDKPTGSGDVELKRDHQDLFDGCVFPTAIDIQMKKGGNYHNGGDVLQLGIDFGLLCLHERQSKLCSDYKVRYCCTKKRNERCAHPGTVKSGFVSRRNRRFFRVGEIVRYRCRNNFVLTGKAILTCNIGAAWSHKVPECNRMASCKRVGRIANGQIAYRGSMKVGATVEYKCNDGYSINGNKLRVCLKHGSWSGRNPTCDRICAKDKIFTNCKPRCPPTCLDKFDVPELECTELRDCEPGCSCSEGMVEVDRADDTCVKATKCPRRQVCKAYGDPHYIMFGSSSTFDFMGLCTYTMSETFRLGLSDERWFSIQVENEARYNVTGGSWVKNVKIILDGGLTEISLNDDGALVNGQTALDAATRMFVLRTSGRSHHVTTAFGVTVTFNGNAVTIRMPVAYRNVVRGLCGDINGNSADDLMMLNGEFAEDFVEMAESFKVKDCGKAPGALRDCSDDEKKTWTDYEFCGSLLNRTGVFGNCVDAISIAQTYYEACIFDMCATSGDNSVLLENLQAYFEDCLDAQVEPPCDWRERLNFAKPTCPPHSEYTDCPSSCHKYCFSGDSLIRCKESNSGGCFCDEGYVWEGKQCILKEECGCEKNGKYFPKGSVVSKLKTGETCICAGRHEVVCGCAEGYIKDESRCREATCEDGICDEHANCVGVGIGLKCDCKPGYQGNGRQCFPATCESSVNLKNGFVKSNGNNRIGDFVSYQCDFGYALRGDSKRFCTSEGRWSGVEPYCKKICEEPRIYTKCVKPSHSCLDRHDLPQKEETDPCSPGCTCPKGTMTIDRYNSTCVRRRDCPKRGVCRAWGDPHYIMFEGSNTFDFMKLCNLTLLEPIHIDRSDNRWLLVIAENELRPNITGGSFVKNAKIQLEGGKFNIVLEKSGAKVNGKAVSDLRTTVFNLHSRGRNQYLITYHGVTIIYNGNAVIIKAPSLYRNEVRGLCGDFNGNSSDDFRARDGRIKDDILEFASSFEVGKCISDSVPTIVCTEEDQQKWSENGYCGAMTDVTGIFADCVRLMAEAERLFEACVYDMCATQGDRKLLIENFEAFVDQCKEFGVVSCNWRQDLGLKEEVCFPNSRYIECPNSCQKSCFQGNETTGCSNKDEGRCECNDDLFIEGQRCIPESDCGCIVNGEYITKGTMHVDYDSNKSCVCNGPGAYDCGCMIGYSKDGDRCRLESCQDKVCDENADCLDTEFGIQCTCRDGFLGDGWSCYRDVVTCFRPQIFYNGHVAHNIPPYTKNKLLIYECYVGFRLLGSPTRVCLNNGQWSSPPPVCRKRV